jgi:hypothetical protein
MGKLKDSLFIVENDVPQLVPLSINIPQFKDLYVSDKSKNKTNYAKQLAYIYFMCEFTDNPYYKMVNKEEELGKQYMGDGKYKPDKKVQACIDVYKKFQYGTDRKAHEACKAMVDSLVEKFVSSKNDEKQLVEVMTLLDKEINSAPEALLKLELLKEKVALNKTLVDNAKSLADLVPKIEKLVETLHSLEKKIEKHEMDSDDDPAVRKIDTFVEDMIYKINNEE